MLNTITGLGSSSNTAVIGRSNQAVLPASSSPQGHINNARYIAYTKTRIPLGVRDGINIFNSLQGEGTLDILKEQALSYLSGFQNRPIQQTESGTSFGKPVTFTPDAVTFDSVIDLVTEAIFFKKDLAPQILERVMFNPKVLAKLVAIHEHGFMIGAKEPAQKNAAISRLIEQYANDDSLLRFVRASLPLVSSTEADSPPVNVYNTLVSDPKLYAQAVVAHRWCCKQHNVDPYNVNKQIGSTAQNSISEKITELVRSSEGRIKTLNFMLANLREDSPVLVNPNVIIGESTFFRELLDKETLSPVQYLLDAYERGIRNIEIAADLLPFDPAKRLPGEYTQNELERIKETAKLLGVNITIHSALVGPLHPKTGFAQALEDPSDNVPLMKETVEMAEKLGAKTIVVHIADRESKEAISNYAEIALSAYGRKASDGTPIKIGFENYMSKSLPPDKRKPFPTIQEHFKPFAEIVKEVARKAVAASLNPNEAIKHATLLLDSAHFNLVHNLEDPVKAVYDLSGLIQNLAKGLKEDPEFGAQLQKAGFSEEEFYRNAVAQLHLNQNIGPIGFKLDSDFNADIHNPVESIGSIDNEGFLSIIVDAGLGEDLVILAEQKKPLSPGGLQFLYNTATNYPGTPIEKGIGRIEHFTETGRRTISAYSAENKDVYNSLKGLLEEQDGTVKSYYAYLAGRFGMDHLIEHLQKRAFHNLLSLHVANNVNSEIIPLTESKLVQHSPGELIIKRGTTIEQARKEASNKFYLVAKGNVTVKAGNGKSIELNAGTPFGEAMLISETERNADVVAGANGAGLVEISETDFWLMYKQLTPFLTRLNERVRKQN